MARLDSKGRTIVQQSTIDAMKRMGMAKAIEKANTPGVGAEFLEAAKRFYGKRIKPGTAGVADAMAEGVAKKRLGGPRMKPSNGQEGSHTVGEAVAVPSKPKFGKNESAI